MVARIMERIMERMEHMDLKGVKIMECPEWDCVGVLWQHDSVTRNVGAKSEWNMVHDTEQNRLESAQNFSNLR